MLYALWLYLGLPCSQAWESAVSLAMQYARHRLVDVLAVASTKLQEVGRYEAAGDLHEQIGDPQGE
jgi:hypothetical protein